MSDRIRWPEVLDKARSIVLSYDTGVTLRQLFYRLVAAEILPNRRAAYARLSDVTAQARRGGEFPPLVDRTREIHRHISFEDPEEAREWLKGLYRRDRTENQDTSIYLGVEKHGIVEQLKSWFWQFGFPVLALGGYSSQSYVDEIAADIEDQGRPAVLIYAGDFDPSGEDILRDFVERVRVFSGVQRIALNVDQVTKYDLPPQMGKATDPRANSFMRKHGELVQVELDALPPDVLRGLYQEAVLNYWDTSTYQDVMQNEREDVALL